MRLLAAIYAFVAVLCLVPSAGAQPANKKPLRVAAAADLKLPLDELGKEFERKTGVPVQVSLGASGTLFAQISNGAPFDLFMSADTDYPRRLVDRKLADSSNMKIYARGTLVLWMSSNWIEKSGGGKGIELSLLKDAGVARVAIANPLHAPYGKAAEATLKKAGIFDQVRSKLITAENVAQAAQFVDSGNVDAGLVALTAVIARKQADGHWQKVPADLYPPIDQAVVITRTGETNLAARQFLEFITSPQAQQVLSRYGFAPVVNQK